MKMKAIVYQGAGKPQFNEVDRPKLLKPTDVIVKMTTTTICGTDLHILKGDLPYMDKGRILGHEGCGIIDEVGSAVNNFKKGDKVIISAVTSCASCNNCKKGLYAHCENGGGWILGHHIDGTQAEYVRIPYADNSLHHLPNKINEEAAAMLSDILPTGYEIGVLKGNVKPGSTVAIVGAGPIGFASLLTAQFYSPSAIIMIDLDDDRLALSKQFGATHTINAKEDIKARIKEITGKDGVDVAMEAVGIPATFDICQQILLPDAHLANIGVHGKPVEFKLQELWIKNVTITTGLVSTNTTPLLLKTVEAKKLEPNKLVTHRFKFSEIEKAYEIFSQAAKNKALKVIITA